MRYNDVLRIRRGWRKSPPTHWLIAWQARFKAPEDDDAPGAKRWRERVATSESEIDVIIAAVNDAGRGRQIGV